MPPKKRRDAGRARGEPIVDSVLLHTLDELARVGLEHLSVARVAKKAKVNKTSVYRRWPTRAALISAALERILIDVSATIPDSGSLRGDLIGVLRPIGVFFDTVLGKAVLRAALTDTTAGSVRSLAARQLAQTGSSLAAMIERARGRGEWRDDADAAQLLFMLIGAMIHRVLLEHELVTARWIERLIGYALEGVRPP